MVEGQRPGGFPGRAAHVSEGKMEHRSVESREVAKAWEVLLQGVEWG